MLSQVANAGQPASQASKNGPQIAAQGISTPGGLQALSPGGLTIIEGTNLTAAGWAAGVPLPRVLGNTFVSVEGVRAPLLTTATGSIEFEVPGDIPVGIASVVVSSSGDTSATVDMPFQTSIPVIWGVVHADGSVVSAVNPVVAGETISLYATGLGAANVNSLVGAAGPTAPTANTAGLRTSWLASATFRLTAISYSLRN